MRLDSDQTLIWNRACGGRDASGVGDRALRDAIGLDGLIQNGGVPNGFETAGDDWLDGVIGFEYFGLDDSDRLQAAFVARLAAAPEDFEPIADADRAGEADTQELLGRLMGDPAAD